jgi:hypothetical protein
MKPGTRPKSTSTMMANETARAMSDLTRFIPGYFL